MEKSIFAVIYQFDLLPGKEKRYQQLWREVSSYFVNAKGALGSALHKTHDGYWVAYSRWPSRTTRDTAWPAGDTPDLSLPKAIRTAIIEMKACASKEKTWPPIEMDLIAYSENQESVNTT